MPPGSLVGALRPDPGPARSWLERELSRPDYQEGLLARLGGWLSDLWEGLRLRAMDASPLSTGAAVVVVVVLVVLVVLVSSRLRREPAAASTDDDVLVAGVSSPEEHRRAAEQALSEGDPDRAVVEAFRALALRSVRRGVLEERPGLTAHELAADLRPLFPSQADALARASVLFDLVFYGDQPATADDARSVLDLDDALRSARPARGGAATHDEPAAAVPR